MVQPTSQIPSKNSKGKVVQHMSYMSTSADASFLFPATKRETQTVGKLFSFSHMAPLPNWQPFNPDI